MFLSGAWFEIPLMFFGLLMAKNYLSFWWLRSGIPESVSAETEKNIEKKCKTERDVPGPWTIPILGTRWIFSCFGSYRMNKIHEAYKDLNQRFGDLCKEEALWNHPVISVFSRRDIETILRKSTKYPLRPPQEVISYYRNYRRDRYTNLGLVNEQGLKWQELRTALTPQLTGIGTIHGFFPALNVVSNSLIELIYNRRSGPEEGYVARKFEDLAYKLGLESTCTLILGRHLGFLNPESKCTLITRLADALRVHFMALRDTFYGLPLWKFLPTSAYKQLINSEDAIYSIISELIDTSISELQDTAKDNPHEAVFLSILRQENLDMRDKKAAIVDFIAAGIHTVGNTLVFLLHLMGSNPQVQENLYAETSGLAPLGCDLTVEDIKKAKYLRAFINEAFRLLPTACNIARILDEPVQLGEYHLRSGTVVILHTWIAGLNELNFKNALECVPERWLQPTVPHSPLLVAPFGNGRRICPGKRFVELALQLILAKITREFEIVVDNKELELEFEFILSPKTPVSFKFLSRRERT